MATGSLRQACGAMIYCPATERYLFLLRNGPKFGNTWGLVGGKIDSGESILDGLNREIQEELGGVIKDARIIPVEQYTSDDGHFVYHTFLIKVDEEFAPVLNNEHKGFCWVRLEDHPRPLHPGLYRTVKKRQDREN